ncbi:MAG: hypothetical protein OEW75_09415, partial [Cyclobacteriaceae bacterium]|nr:hypothetical protein [Cyclobacteriaceae bacterium]
SSRIWYYGDEASYTIVKLAAVLDILTISTYSATACLFAAIAFSGIWALFLVFYRLYPDYKNGLAWAILFVPSVIFWGSGIFKDTITLAAVGWSVFAFYKIVFERSRILYPIILIASFYVIYVIKIYILLTLMPAMIIWLLLLNLEKVKSVILKVLILPVFVVIAALVAFQLVSKVAEDNNKYALDQIANTAKVTAYDIRYGWGARNGVGSGYTLGELDGTVSSMIKLIPAAINVALFRPYLFEVGNPLMLMAAVESTVFLFATLFVLYSVFRRSAFRVFFNREVLFCLSFSLVFAFAVGISAFNFGTLSRYKLPLIPFYLTALVIIYYKSKRERKLEEFESTE